MTELVAHCPASRNHRDLCWIFQFFWLGASGLCFQMGRARQCQASPRQEETAARTPTERQLAGLQHGDKDVQFGTKYGKS